MGSKAGFHADMSYQLHGTGVADPKQPNRPNYGCNSHPTPNLTTLRAVVPIWLLMQDGEMRYILHAVGYFVGQEAILSIRAWLWS